MEEDGQHGHGLDGQYGQDGEEATHIHSADGIHGYLEDGGECHTMAGHGGGGKCPLVWDPMAG